MDSGKHISVVINPFSGTGFSEGKNTFLRKKLEEWGLKPEFHYFEKTNSTERFIKSELDVGSELFVALGGDGTVNMVARHLTGKETALCIIPNGSGNGLARHLKIPQKFTNSISIIKSHNTSVIDYGLVNEIPFFCTSGIGFDATVAHVFSQKSNRGLYNYIKVILSKFAQYREEEYQVKINGKHLTIRAFLITLANAAQFGNNAFISPEALIDDGFLDFCQISPFPRILAPVLGLQVLSKKINKSQYYDMTRATEVTIKRQNPGWAHIDGDPVLLPETIHYRIVPAGLKVLVPEKRNKMTK